MLVGLPAKSRKKRVVLIQSKSNVRNLQLLQLRLWNVSIGQRSYVYLVMVTGSLVDWVEWLSKTSMSRPNETKVEAMEMI